MTVFSIDLPEILPSSILRVDEEEHQYVVYSTDSGPDPKDEYTLEKAPIEDLIDVTGTLDNQHHTFDEGTDYELSSDDNRIVWLSGDRPDAGTKFYVTYRAYSIGSRYVDASEEELQTAEDKLFDSIQSKFVAEASGEDLDDLGKLFGPIIGTRSGRTDEQYRKYLQSIVQSFISRGTKTGIKLAISAATDVPIEDISIVEDFENNSYEVLVIPQTPVTGSTLEQIADIADPSGVKQKLTRFTLDEDILTADDIVAIDDNTTEKVDTVGTTDIFDIPPKAAIKTDVLASDDSVDAVTENLVAWDTRDWNDDGLTWAYENN